MYVDGWNMHGSMKNAGIRAYGWCDFRLLTRQLTGHDDVDIGVKFFTASDTPHPKKIPDKQARWWKALRLLGSEIVEGEFRPTGDETKEWTRYSGNKLREKMTDVALASHLIADCSRVGFTGKEYWAQGYDEAVLLAQDTDYVPAVRIVSRAPFAKRVHVLLPPSDLPARDNALRIWTKEFAGSTVVIRQLTRTDFAKALLPRFVQGPAGEVAECHHEWMYREKYERQSSRSRLKGEIANDLDEPERGSQDEII
jgi:hypothetical protein